MKADYRLKKNSDFQFVFRTGVSKANRQFVVYYTNQPKIDHFRIGISVSKRVGNAVTRNRIKRYIRELMRQMDDQISGKMDYVIIARKPTADMDFREMKKSLAHVLKRAGVYKRHAGVKRR